MSAIIVSIDRMPCVLPGEQDKQITQRPAEDRWVLQPSSDCSGLSFGDYRQTLALHGQLRKLLKSGKRIGSNLKMMSRLFDLHQRVRAAQAVKGMV